LAALMPYFGKARILGENVTNLVHRSAPAESLIEVIENFDGVRISLLSKKN
jgi:hypothetical protein